MRTTVSVLIALVLASAQQQPPAPPSTAAISGVIIDSSTGRPVVGATVQLSAPPALLLGVGDPTRLPVFRPVRQITDDIGRFVFTDLPAATFTLTANKYGYFDGAYGRTGLSSPNKAPKRITLAAGQWMRDLRIDLLKPGTISGIVRNETGEPVVEATVRAYTQIYVGGTLQLASSQSATTDDRGEYRISNVPPGKYIVAVPSGQHAMPVDQTVPVTPAVPQNAFDRDMVYRGFAAIGVDPIHRLMLMPNSLVSPDAGGAKPQAYPITLYPGVRTIADAMTIDIGLGEEKTSIDFQLRPVPAFRVSGHLDGPGDAIAGMSLRLMAAGMEMMGRGMEQATALVGNDGNFTFLNVPSGSYTLIANRTVSEYSYGNVGFIGVSPFPGVGRASMAANAAFAAPPGTMVMRTSFQGSQKYQGRKTVTVSGHDVADVIVPLETGVSISGRIVFDLSNPDANLPIVNVTADPANGDATLNQPRSVRDVDDDPTYFYIESVMPGSYLLRTVGTGALKSVIWGDKNYTDVPLEVAGGKNITGIVLTVTDQVATLSGTIRDRTGQAAPAAATIVFPADRNLWRGYGTQPSRIRSLPGSTTGAYAVRGLPAGDYFAVAVDEASADRWQDPAFFEAAARVATRFSIAWGETKTLDVIVQDIK